MSLGTGDFTAPQHAQMSGVVLFDDPTIGSEMSHHLLNASPDSFAILLKKARSFLSQARMPFWES